MGKLGSGWKSQNCGRFWGNWHRETPRACAKFRRNFLKLNWKTYRATVDQWGIEPPTDPDRPYCICLVGHWLGRREDFPKTITFMGKSKLDFPKKVVTFRPPSRGLRKHRPSLYSHRLSLYSPIFPKIVADFWENWPRETARALRVQPDRSISSIVLYIFI